MVARCTAALLVVSAAAATAGPPILEKGEVMNGGIAIELGAMAHIGASEFSSAQVGTTPMSYGIVFRDRNGSSARMVMGLLIAVSSAIAQSGPKSVESKTYRSGNYLVTETTTTYYSEAEKAEMRENTNDAIDGLFSTAVAEFELELYGRQRFGYGDSSGYKMNMLFGGRPDDVVNLQVGLGWGSVDSVVTDGGMDYRIKHRYLGLPIRAVGDFGPVAWALTWEWNWLAHGVEDNEKMPQLQDNEYVAKVGHHPLSAELSTAILGRVYIRGGVSLRSVSKFTPGYKLSAGFRF